MVRILACRQDVLAAILIFLALIVSGCTSEWDVTSDSRIDVERPAESAAIPLSIGVYFSPEFLAFEDRRPGGPYLRSKQLIIRFGRTSADLFDGVFNMAFEDVRFLDDRPPFATGQLPITAVIEPRIEHAAVTGRLADWTVELIYLFRLYDIDGNLVLTWTVNGLAKTDKSNWPWAHGGTEPVQDAAMKMAGENLMRSLFNDPRISAWLKTQGVDLAGQ